MKQYNMLAQPLPENRPVLFGHIGAQVGGRRAVRSLACAAALLCLLGAPAGAAQEVPGLAELSLQAGYRVGGEFATDGSGTSAAYELDESNSQRIALNIRASRNTQWEVLYGRQDTALQATEVLGSSPKLDLRVDYFQFGGTYLFEGTRMLPYFVMTAGASRFVPRQAELDAETYFSGSVGGGLQLLPGKRFGIRLETRVFGSLVDSEGGIFCRSGYDSSFCAIRIDGDVLFQWETSVGLVVRFR
jgi:hypothetical protein